VADLFSLLVGSVCLGLFVLAALPNIHAKRSLWAGYRSLALLLCWLTAGPLVAVAVAVIGSAVGASLHPPADRLAALRRITLSGVVLLVAVALLTLLGGTTPVRALTLDTMLPVVMALLGGFISGHVVEALWIGRVVVEPRQIISEILQILLALFLPPVAQNNPGLFILVIALIALQIWYLLDAERARAALHRRAQEMALLNTVGQFTSDNLNLDDVLWNIYTHVVKLIDVSIFYIALYDDERQMLDFRLVVADGKRVVWQPRKFGQGTAEHVIRERKLLHIRARDRRKDAQFESVNSITPFMDYLGVPLLVGARVVGVLSVLSTVSEDAFGDDEISVLQTVANQAALAVRNATLYTRQAEMVEKLSRINESVQQVLFNSNRDRALDAACQTAQAISGAAAVAIFLKQQETVTLKTGAGLTPAYRAWIEAHPVSVPPDIRLISNVSSQTDAELQQFARHSEFQALIELPLRSGQVDWGLLAVYYPTPHYFRQQDIDLLATLANQITAMLENTHLFEIMEQYAYEMSQLVQLSRITTSSLNLPVVMRDVADMFRQMTSANRVAVIALEGQQARLLTVSGTVNGTYSEPLPELLELMSAQHPSPRAYRAGDATLSAAMAAQMAAHEEQMIVLAPLVVENEVRGAVLLGCQQVRDFAGRDWQLVEAASNQIAAQINNIYLYEKIQQDRNRRLAQVAVIEDVARQVSSSLDFNQIINHVLEAALTATEADLVQLGLVTDADQLWVIEQRLEADHTRRRYFSQDRQPGLAGEVLRSGRPVLVPDNRAASFYESDYGTAYRSALGVPLVKTDAVIGVLLVESRQASAFSQEQEAFLSSLAGHAVMSIENARFLDERRHEINLLKSLRDLSLWLVSADDTRSVGYEILETTLQLLQGKQAILFAQEGDQLRPVAKLWYSEQPVVNAEEKLPRALAAEAARTAELVHLIDVSDHPLHTPAFDYDSIVAIPLKHARHVPYIIVVTFDGHRQLIERDLNTIDLLAGQAIGHLENASLHERIRAGRDQMRAILNSTRDGLILLDCDARLIEVNPSAQQLLAMDLSQQIGQFFPDVLLRHIQTAGADTYTADDVAELVNLLHTRPEAETRREMRRRSDSRTLYLEEVGLPVRDQDGEITGRLLVLRDVTEARLLEEQREDLTDMLIHDLRGPLGAIQNAMDLALPRLAEPADYADNAVLIAASRENAARLLRLVETLLDISRMQRPGLELRREAVSIETMAQSAITALLTTAQKARIRIRTDFPSDLPPVDVDHEKIERVIINLLDNALRYAPSGSDILLTAHVLEPQQWVEIRVADSGPGIPPERHTDIFERFRRIPGQEPRRGHRGHGLGLNFARMAVEKHGGSIRIADDCALPGACFAFTLPAAADPASAAGAQTKTAPG